jgi:Lon protease-like protein
VILDGGKLVGTTIPQVPLPEILPVFPLTGVLLLPGTILPLHIFEPRYRAMVEDALSADRVFGMIQPFAPQQDNRPLPGAEKETPELYKIGCAGYIENWEKLPDGRFFIQLKGVNRFRFTEELPTRRGYRLVKADYRDFPDASLHENWHCERQVVLEALGDYGKANGVQTRPEQAGRFSDLELVNLLAVSLPFHPAEKQALLEAPTLKSREAVLVNLLRLAAGPPDAGSDIPPRTVN